jgi:YVTN family beta-propeller protein
MMRTGVAVILLLGVTWMNSLAAEPEAASSRGRLLVTNKGDQTLGIIDAEAGRQIATVKESGFTGHEVAASPDGRLAFVPIYGDSGVGKPGSDGRTMDVVDLASQKIVATVDFGRPVRPHGAVFGPKDGLLYVTTELTNTIDVIDPRTHKIVAQIPTDQPESHMLAITRDGKHAYTSNVHAGTVSAIDLAARKVLAVIPVSAHAQRIALSVDDRYAFTADQDAPRLAVIDTATHKVKTWVPLPSIAYGTAPTLDGKWLLAALPGTNQVAVIDLGTMKVERTIDVPATPQEILVRPDGKMAYVSCDQSGQVAAINLTTWKVEKLIPAGPMADGLAWARFD